MTRWIVALTFLIAFLVALFFTGAVARAQGQGTPRRTEQIGGREAAAGEVLFKFRTAPAPDVVNEINRLTDAASDRAIGRTGLLRVRSRSLDVATLIARLANRADVLYAEPNYVVHAFTEPNDLSFPQLWGLKNQGQAVNGGLTGIAGADIHATQAWDLSLGSTAQVVAVIDTGIDYTHPDLVANIWSAPSSFTVNIDGQPIVCPAGSHGFNAITLTCDPMDDHDHGTHVAGTIGASGNNAVGVVGVNWVAQLMGIKFLDSTGSGTHADAIKAIDFAIQVKQAFAITGRANIRVLSNSWGGSDFSQAIQDEILAANDADMLVVAAAGNNGISNDFLPNYPASYDSPNIISVAATDNRDARAWFSNYSPTSVDLSAPGVDVLSTVRGSAYAFQSGTSMATPHVSGAAALVLSRCSLDTATLKDTILSTVEPVPSLAALTVTGGRLDVNNAIRSCVEPPGVPTMLTAVPGDGRITLHWSGGSGALSFNVKRSPAAGGPYTLLASGVKGKTYVDTGVVNGTSYYYVVSGTNTFGESADSNEATATPKTASDLIVSTLTVPAAGGVGATIVLSAAIKNQGLGTSNPTTTRFYLSRSTTIDASAIQLDCAQDVPSLAPGATATASLTVQIPDVAMGLYFVVAEADADDVEAETQESNNTLARALPVGPDLVVSLVTAPSNAAPGGTILIGDTVKNQGGGMAAPTTTRFYLSTNTIIDGADVLLPAVRQVPELAAGAVSTGSTTALVPASVTTGSYYLIVKADADSAVAETQESNNAGFKILQVGGDLVVSVFNVPFKAGAGSPIVVTDTITNTGAAAVSSSTTRFYLSKNVLLDASAIPLSDGRAVPDLAAGAASSGSTTVLIPSTVAMGNYFVIAKADGDSQVSETQEVNNTAARAVAIGGDLVISALTVPSTTGGGSTIVVTDTTSNTGGGAVGPTTTRFYLSSNNTLDGSDVPLAGGRSVPGLTAGAASSGSIPVTIPAGVTAGTYYIIAIADADNVVGETQETNNIAARATQVGGDLVVSVLSVPATGGSSATIVVSDTTRNQGAGAVGASVTRFYLSTNTTLDGSDTPLGSRIVADLSAGGSSTGTTTLTLPPSLAVATYYVVAQADANGTVPESQETNNTLARAIAIGPDLTVASMALTFSVVAGSTVSVTDTVRNQGGDLAPESTIRFYLSSDVYFDASDAPFPTGRAVPVLPAGATSSGSTAITIPTNTTPGYYYVIAAADGDRVVMETQEGNNLALRAIQVTPAP